MLTLNIYAFKILRKTLEPKRQHQLGNPAPLTQVIISVKDPQIDVAGGFTTYLIMGMDKMGTY